MGPGCACMRQQKVIGETKLIYTNFNFHDPRHLKAAKTIIKAMKEYVVAKKNNLSINKDIQKFLENAHKIQSHLQLVRVILFRN